MKKCENCEEKHDEKYGSGRFCSSKCARGFSTKNKRKLINEKVSLKLKQEHHERYYSICPNCENEFETEWKKRKNKFCSKRCSIDHKYKDPEYIKKLSLGRIKKIREGVVNSSGIRMIYTFNESKIKCDSKIEYSCLDFFEKKGAEEMKRCDFSIEYKDEEKTRRFLPDFCIKIRDEIFIVEAKGYMSVNSVNEKWRDYNRLSVLKKEALKKYCEDNNFTSFWFTKDLNLKFYNEI